MNVFYPLVAFCFYLLILYTIRKYFFIAQKISSRSWTALLADELRLRSQNLYPPISIYPSYIHLHLFNSIPSTSETTNHIKYNEGYTVAVRTKDIDDRVIEASIIKSNHFRREESYIVKYYDPIEQPVIDYDSNPCKSFSFPYCILQNYDDSDHYSFSFSIFYQSNYVIYIDIDELDIPLNYLNSTLIDSVLRLLHNNEIDMFTCSSYANRLLNGCLIVKQSLIRDIITKTTMSKGKMDILDYIPLYYKEMNKELRVETMLVKEAWSPYLNVKDKLVPSLFGCNDLSENDTSFTVSVTTYRRPKMKMVLDGFNRQDLQPKQVIMIQNTDILHWNSSLFANRNTQYYHIWCSNWNSKYVGKYFPALMFDTTFNFVIDDDYYLSYTKGFSDIMSVIPQDNSIYGLLCTRIESSTYKIREDSKDYCDHSHNMVYARVKHIKIWFQYEMYTYAFGEDAQFGIINYVACGIASRRKEIPVEASHEDEYRAGGQLLPQLEVKSSYHDVSYPSRKDQYIYRWITNIYQYFTKKGYVLYDDRKESHV